MRAVTKLGEVIWSQWNELRHAAAVIATALGFSILPRAWRRTVRKRSAHQILAVGVEPLGFVCLIAAFVGISVVVQLAFWTSKAGQSQLLGPLLVAVVARELGPLLTNIVVIVRSSSAMATELGIMKINGEIADLEKQGNDTFEHLVMPRVLGVAVSTLCLTIVFILVALASGFVFGAWLGTGSRDFWFFTNTVLNALHPQDMAGILAKSLLPALFTSASCCIGGLGVGAVMDIPQATQRALTRSIAGLFIISAVVSWLTYL
ncbi:MAG TPA: ABC transporter permease [Verrucomicrobiae bacterium]|jgi:phospholipid/cholesterol/gamma-HCH transport system permease protein